MSLPVNRVNVGIWQFILFPATFQKYTLIRQPRLKSNGEGLTLFLRKMYFTIDVIILKYSEGYAWLHEHLFPMYVNHLEKNSQSKVVMSTFYTIQVSFF